MSGASQLSFRETRRLMRVDKARLHQCCTSRGLPVRSVALSPSRICVFLYRLSRYMHVRGWGVSARFFWQLNMFLTGADISPICNLGEGLLVVHPVAVTLVGSAGNRLSVEGSGGMGGGLAMNDIGAGPGLPILGDDVTIAMGAMVLGPVRIGSGVQIGAGCTVTRDVPDNNEVMVHEFRVRRSKGLVNE